MRQAKHAMTRLHACLSREQGNDESVAASMQRIAGALSELRAWGLHLGWQPDSFDSPARIDWFRQDGHEVQRTLLRDGMLDQDEAQRLLSLAARECGWTLLDGQVAMLRGVRTPMRTPLWQDAAR